MKTLPNRVLLAFKAWEDRKKEMEPLLRNGTGYERVMRKLQLNHLHQARHRLTGNVRPDERPFMVLLNEHINKLEKQQHPNLLLRLFFQLKDRLLDRPVYLKREAQQRVQNMVQLNGQLDKNGFGYLSGKLENHLAADQTKVNLPLEVKMNDSKNIRFGLHFEKDQYGNFQLDQIACSLYKDGHLARAAAFETAQCPYLKGHEMINLLHNGAVRQTYRDNLGRERQRWAELGEDGLKYYEPSKDFSVRALLEKMPAITTNKEELTRYLESGQNTHARWKQGRDYQVIYIQADPASRSLKIFDESKQPVTPEQLNERAKQRLAIQKTEQVAPQQNRKRAHRQHF